MDRRSFLAGAVGFVVLSPAHGAELELVRPRDLYNKDLSFSEHARSLRGRRVTATGFMAPSLKAESTFFVLTNRPVAVCPFCDTEAEWPDDILAVYVKRTVEVVPYNVRIIARGRLELGAFNDPDIGFVSRVRLVDSVYERN